MASLTLTVRKSLFRMRPSRQGSLSALTPEYPGAWLSLVERLVRDQEVVGSNPAAPIYVSA